MEVSSDFAMVASIHQLTPGFALGDAWPSSFEETSVGCALIDCDGRLVSVTRAFAEMLDCQDTQLFGQSVFEILDLPDKRTHIDLLADGKYYFVTPTSGRGLRWSIHKIASGNVLAGYYIGLLCGEDGHQGFESQPDHRDRLAFLGEITAGITHEIAGPLSIIANNAELLLDEVVLNHQARQSLSAMCDEAHRLGNLLKDVLCFSRDLPFRLSELDAVRLVKKSVELFQPQCTCKSVSLRVEAEPDLPMVAGDADRLHQVIFNLLKNACDASPDGCEVLILVKHAATETDERAIEIEILDRGDGIAPDDLDRIFEPFFSTKSSGHGTGLGLPISRHIVTAHGGELHLSSLVGKGTSAIILLPVWASRDNHPKELGD